eukprot:299961-Prymnesium_polylepis.2
MRLMSEAAAVDKPSSLEGASSKFSQQEDLVSLTYGGISSFFKGLEGSLGMPTNNLMEGMRQEHTKGPDRETNFKVWLGREARRDACAARCPLQLPLLVRPTAAGAQLRHPHHVAHRVVLCHQAKSHRLG